MSSSDGVGAPPPPRLVDIDLSKCCTRDIEPLMDALKAWEVASLVKHYERTILQQQQQQPSFTSSGGGGITSPSKGSSPPRGAASPGPPPSLPAALKLKLDLSNNPLTHAGSRQLANFLSKRDLGLSGDVVQEGLAAFTTAIPTTGQAPEGTAGTITVPPSPREVEAVMAKSNRAVCQRTPTNNSNNSHSHNHNHYSMQHSGGANTASTAHNTNFVSMAVPPPGSPRTAGSKENASSSNSVVKEPSSVTSPTPPTHTGVGVGAGGAGKPRRPPSAAALSSTTSSNPPLAADAKATPSSPPVALSAAALDETSLSRIDLVHLDLSNTNALNETDAWVDVFAPPVELDDSLGHSSSIYGSNNLQQGGLGSSHSNSNSNAASMNRSPMQTPNMLTFTASSAHSTGGETPREQSTSVVGFPAFTSLTGDCRDTPKARSVRSHTLQGGRSPGASRTSDTRRHTHSSSSSTVSTSSSRTADLSWYSDPPLVHCGSQMSLPTPMGSQSQPSLNASRTSNMGNIGGMTPLGSLTSAPASANASATFVNDMPPQVPAATALAKGVYPACPDTLNGGPLTAATALTTTNNTNTASKSQMLHPRIHSLTRIQSFTDNNECYVSSTIHPLLTSIVSHLHLQHLTLNDCMLSNEAMAALALGLDGTGGGSGHLTGGGGSGSGSGPTGGLDDPPIQVTGLVGISQLKTLSLEKNNIGSHGLRMLSVGVIRRWQHVFAGKSLHASPPPSATPTLALEDRPGKAKVDVPTIKLLSLRAPLNEVLRTAREMTCQAAIAASPSNGTAAYGRKAREDQALREKLLGLETLNLKGNRVAVAQCTKNLKGVRSKNAASVVLQQPPGTAGLSPRPPTATAPAPSPPREGISHNVRPMQTTDSSPTNRNGSPATSTPTVVVGASIPAAAGEEPLPQPVENLPPQGDKTQYDPSGLLALSAAIRLLQGTLTTLNLSFNDLGHVTNTSTATSAGSGRAHAITAGVDHGGTVEVCEAVRSCARVNTSTLSLSDGNGFSDATLRVLNRASGFKLAGVA